MLQLRTIETIKDAKEICGGLSRPEKLRTLDNKQFTLTYNLPAQECKLGSILRKKKGSTCSGCYALKNRYKWPANQKAMYRRLDSIYHPLWTDAMIYLIKRQSPDFFRWLDSGDIQSMQHFENILEVCRRTPNTKHWLPTREIPILKKYIGTIPDNLCLRVSDHFIGKRGIDWPHYQTSGVVFNKLDATCPAHKQNNKCGDCRVCWDRSVPHVDYPFH